MCFTALCTSHRLLEQRLVASSCLSEWNSTPTGQILMKFCIWEFFNYLLRKLKFDLNPSRITDNLHKDQWAFMISHWIVVGMGNATNRSCTENQNTRLMFNIFSPKIVPLMRKCGKNIARPARDDSTMLRRKDAIWMPDNYGKITDTHTHTHTHSKCLLLIALPRPPYFIRKLSVQLY